MKVNVDVFPLICIIVTYLAGAIWFFDIAKKRDLAESRLARCEIQNEMRARYMSSLTDCCILLPRMPLDGGSLVVPGVTP